MITQGTCNHVWGAVVLLRSGLIAWMAAYQDREAIRAQPASLAASSPAAADGDEIIAILTAMTLAHVEGHA